MGLPRAFWIVLTVGGACRPRTVRDTAVDVLSGVAAPGAHDARSPDVGRADATAEGATDAVSSAGEWVPVPAPTAADLASLRGPLRVATCEVVEGSRGWNRPPSSGGWSVDERCGSVTFYRSRLDVEDLGASTMDHAFPEASANEAWTCETIHTPCLTLTRALMRRDSADGTFVEFRCRTTVHRFDRRVRVEVGWPCNDGDPTPGPLYLRRRGRDTSPASVR